MPHTISTDRVAAMLNERVGQHADRDEPSHDGVVADDAGVAGATGRGGGGAHDVDEGLMAARVVEEAGPA
ncbi:MAG: hypothetical protein ACRD08_22825 [Acidimicrobiales bacterium]